MARTRCRRKARLLLTLSAALGANCVVAVPPAAATAPVEPPRPSLTLGSGVNSTRSGDYTIHHNALPTLQLSPAIAVRSGVTRSANRALLNVSVRRGPRAAESVAVPARIEAAATNPAGQRQSLNLREVREGDAIYYLGEARIDERDELVFEMVVTPEGGTPINVRYRQEFWPPLPVR